MASCSVEYANDDSKELSHGSKRYDLIGYAKEKAGRKDLRAPLDFSHRRKEEMKCVARNFKIFYVAKNSIAPTSGV